MLSKIISTLTIGIPAHNESKNIARMLESVLAQERKSYTIEKIVVACDSCTDNTAGIVRRTMKMHPEVELIDDGFRLGKSQRLNNFFKLSDSDIFIAFDADVFLDGNMVIERLVSGFRGEHVGLVGGRGVPRHPDGFWEKVFVTWAEIWYEIRKNLANGNNIHNHEGCISAMAKPFYKQVVIPSDVVSDDEYLYFRALELGFMFVFVSSARVLYRCPTTLRDYFAQSFRFISTKFSLHEYFSFDILPYYFVPFQSKAVGIGRVFLRHPVFTIFSLMTQIFIRISQLFFQQSYQNGVWNTIKSSK